eukprot:3838632-Rhodomonas_salina.3
MPSLLLRRMCVSPSAEMLKLPDQCHSGSLPAVCCLRTQRKDRKDRKNRKDRCGGGGLSNFAQKTKQRRTKRGSEGRCRGRRQGERERERKDVQTSTCSGGAMRMLSSWGALAQGQWKLDLCWDRTVLTASVLTCARPEVWGQRKGHWPGLGVRERGFGQRKGVWATNGALRSARRPVCSAGSSGDC